MLLSMPPRVLRARRANHRVVRRSRRRRGPSRPRIRLCRLL